jgi:hypothetical protein
LSSKRYDDDVCLNRPQGTKERQGRRLKRSVYRSRGPDFLWHIDGYDKLKPFGFACHACIDGYSRNVLWLHVAVTNNQPSIIAGYFVDCVKAFGGCLTIVRGDRGTENGIVAAIQRMLRHECTHAFSGEKAFLYGPSTANQINNYLED